ncbi:hypothetical protein, partial [Acinetobacter baumannii]|uniref:hypothetical protein n=1 Tax=Acinetobacter baumannii TaxID=470 RepID=UPI001C09646F
MQTAVVNLVDIQRPHAPIAPRAAIEIGGLQQQGLSRGGHTLPAIALTSPGQKQSFRRPCRP